MSAATQEARHLIVKAYAKHGVCVLACECHALEVYIDGDAVGFDGDAELVAALIDHARHDHVNPRRIFATTRTALVDYAESVKA